MNPSTPESSHTAKQLRNELFAALEAVIQGHWTDAEVRIDCAAQLITHVQQIERRYEDAP